jgi:hypothetical protein
MGWIRWTGKTLEFVGKLAQTDSFEKWAETQGEKIITEVGLKTGGYVFGIGTNRKARNFVWDDLNSIATTSPELGVSIQDFVLHYPDTIDTLASKWDKLPHLDVNLCVLPRFLVNREALIDLRKRLGNSEELAKLKGGESLREYFFSELVHQLDSVYTAAALKAAPDHPVELGSKWIIRFTPSYQWQGGSGQYFVYSHYSRTSKGATKEQKKQGKEDGANLLAKCQKWLGELSSIERAQLEKKFP